MNLATFRWYSRWVPPRGTSQCQFSRPQLTRMTSYEVTPADSFIWALENEVNTKPGSPLITISYIMCVIVCMVTSALPPQTKLWIRAGSAMGQHHSHWHSIKPEKASGDGSPDVIMWAVFENCNLLKFYQFSCIYCVHHRTTSPNQ